LGKEVCHREHRGSPEVDAFAETHISQKTEKSERLQADDMRGYFGWCAVEADDNGVGGRKSSAS
jgi:hypothetical protein